MKTCSQCGIEKELSEFRNHPGAKDGKYSACSECAKAQSKKHYAAHKQQICDQVQQRRKRDQQRFLELKQTLSCICCGESDHVCLDFHHTDPTQKESTVSWLIGQVGWGKIQEEINKCVVVCRNCHAKLHAGRITLTGDMAERPIASVC